MLFENTARHPRPLHPRRSFVSAQRIYDALRYRLGCRPADDFSNTCSYWFTPAGRSFKVDEPGSDYDVAAVVRRDGQQQMFFSYEYARTLLAHVASLINDEPAVRPEPEAEITRPIDLTPREPAAAKPRAQLRLVG